MSPQSLNTLVAFVGALLAVGSLIFCLIQKKFGRAEVLVLLVGAILVVVPIVGTLRIKTNNTELEIIRKQVADVRDSIQSVARVQNQILDVQKESVRVAVAPPSERKEEIAGVLDQIKNLDEQATAIEQKIAATDAF